MVRRPRFSVIGNGRFLISVDSKEEIRSVLAKRAWKVGARTLIASHWTPGQEMKITEEQTVLLWIRLPGLLVNLWNEYSYQSMAKSINGVFVKSDQFMTKREKLGFTRIQLEVPVMFHPRPSIKLDLGEGQKVDTNDSVNHEQSPWDKVTSGNAVADLLKKKLPQKNLEGQDSESHPLPEPSHGTPVWWDRDVGAYKSVSRLAHSGGDTAEMHLLEFWLGIWMEGWSLKRDIGAIAQIVSWERNHTLGLAAMVKLRNDTFPCAVVKWSRPSASMGETWLLNFCLEVVTQDHKLIVLQANNKRWLQWINKAVRRQPRLIAKYSMIEQHLASLQIDNKYPVSTTVALFFLADEGQQLLIYGQQDGRDVGR
ncbi:hypothetical protein EJ110_NYTH05491 [Nymphaea thermarum]|nr:hypothetical protein EJ110_NYTH05491 [Nymphaea thermarum]